DPAHLPENHLAPPVVIEEIEADDVKLSPRAPVHLPARTRDLRIDYTALSFVCPQKVRFRYKLEGRDHEWQEAGTRRQAFYTDLPPGSYRFRVIASNDDGLWNEAGANQSFSVAPAYYQTVWFRLVITLAAIMTLWTLYSLRMQQMAKYMNARFEERIAERN